MELHIFRNFLEFEQIFPFLIAMIYTIGEHLGWGCAC